MSLVSKEKRFSRSNLAFLSECLQVMLKMIGLWYERFTEISTMEVGVYYEKRRVIHELDAILADLEEKYCSDYSEDTLKLYKDCTNDFRIFVDKIKLSDYSVDKIIDCLLVLQIVYKERSGGAGDWQIQNRLSFSIFYRLQLIFFKKGRDTMEYLKEQYLKEKSSETTWTLVDDMETEEYQHTAEAEDKEPDQSHDDLESVLWPVSREDAILLEQLVGPLPELDKYLRPEVF